MNVFTEEIMNPLFSFLESTEGVVQIEIYHPEKDVFSHLLQTLHWAFRETYDTDLILAAMLHDIGKAVESHGHEQIAVKLLYDYCSVKTLWLIENHMRVWALILGEMQKLSKIKELILHPWLSELVHLARFDKLGRDPNKKIVYNKDSIVNKLNYCAEKYFEKIQFNKE